MRSAVDTYCQEVDEYVSAASGLMDDPASTDLAQLQAQVQQLQQTGSRLVQEMIGDPVQAAKVQECTIRLQQALPG
jgi:hypothetical protein